MLYYRSMHGNCGQPQHRVAGCGCIGRRKRKPEATLPRVHHCVSLSRGGRCGDNAPYFGIPYDDEPDKPCATGARGWTGHPGWLHHPSSRSAATHRIGQLVHFRHIVACVLHFHERLLHLYAASHSDLDNTHTFRMLIRGSACALTA